MSEANIRFWFPFSIITLLVISFMSNDLFIPSMPDLATAFNVSPNSIQQAIALWFYGAMTLQILLGPVSDRYGRKPILLMGTVILIAASFLCAWSSTITGFLIGRFLQGVGVSGIMVTAFAALHEVYEKQNNGTKILGYVGLCTALSPLAGPLLGGYIAAWFGWQMNFFVVAWFGIALLALLIKCMPETLEAPKNLAWKQLFQGYQSLIQDGRFTTTVGSYGLLFFAGGAFLAVAPFICVNLLGYPVEYVGYGMMPMFIAYMIAAGLAEKLEKRFGAVKLIGVSLLALSVLMVGYIVGSNTFETNTVFVMAGMVIYYVGLGLVGPPLNNISLSLASSENKGSASALLTVIMMLGSAIGASCISYFYNGHLLPIALVMGVAIIFAWLLTIIYLSLVSAKNDVVLS